MSRIKQILISLLTGFLILAAVFGFSIFCSSDMRATYFVGAGLLFLAGAITGRQPIKTWLDVVLLCLPLEVVFGVTGVPRLLPLWPNLLLWPAAAALGFYMSRARSNRFAKICVFCALVALSTWYCVRYLPDQIAKSLSRYQ